MALSQSSAKKLNTLVCAITQLRPLLGTSRFCSFPPPPTSVSKFLFSRPHQVSVQVWLSRPNDIVCILCNYISSLPEWLVGCGLFFMACLTLKTEALPYSETLVTTHTMLHSNTPEDLNINMTSVILNSAQFKFSTKQWTQRRNKLSQRG